MTILKSCTLRYSYLRAVDVFITKTPRRSNRGKVNIYMVCPRTVSAQWHYSQTIYEANTDQEGWSSESVACAREPGLNRPLWNMSCCRLVLKDMAFTVHSDIVTQRCCNGSTFVLLRYCSRKNDIFRGFLFHLNNPCRDICWCFQTGLILEKSTKQESSMLCLAGLIIYCSKWKIFQSTPLR